MESLNVSFPITLIRAILFTLKENREITRWALAG
jgi:hypothetical protein